MTEFKAAMETYQYLVLETSNALISILSSLRI